jgi:tripartite ATP-independent transporter DctP family solute receptor
MCKPLRLMLVALLVGVWALGAQAAPIVLKFSNIQEPSHPSSLAAKFMAARIGEMTNGEIKVEVYDSRQLGDARENVENIRNGSLGFTDVSMSNLSQVDKRMDMFSLPYIFKSKAHYWFVLNSPKAWEFVKPLESKGIKVVSWIDSGARNFFTQKPVRTPDDLKGQKIRVMASPVMVNSMQAMGANGVPLAWGELYNALQTGVVDGAENNNPSILSMKFYEVSKYYTLDEHMRIPDVFIVSKKVYDRLSKSQQAAIDRAGIEAQAYMTGAWSVAEQDSLKELKSKFVEIIDPKKAPFQHAVANLVKDEAAKLGVTDMVDWIQKTGDNF